MGILNMSNDDFAKWLDELRVEAPEPKTIVFEQDPIALGCAAYRVWTENHVTRWMDFEHVAVEAADRELADRIRTYYQERTNHILIDILKNGPTAVSEFRKKLSLIVHNQMHEYTAQDRGILYKLPYFYHEDTALERLFAGNGSNDYYRALADSKPQPEQFRLTLLDSVLVSRKHGETTQYWFRDNTTPALYQWTIKNDNPLHSLVRSIVQKPEIDVRALATTKHIRHHSNSVYRSIFNVELV
jgi:aromatic ring-cleaving dioxygenase